MIIDTYLLQRASFDNKEHSKGIDKILSFHYMGGSEFEFGALPKSLKNIRADIENYKYSEHLLGGKKFTLFSNNEIRDDFDEWLVMLKENKIRLKESSFFDYAFSEDSSSFLDTDFWWSLDDDFMFWVSNEKFESDFKKLIC